MLALLSASRLQPINISRASVAQSLSSRSGTIPLTVIRRAFASNNDIHVSTPLALDSNHRYNMGIVIIPEGTTAIIENFGKFSHLAKPGLHFLLPFYQKIPYSFTSKRSSFSVSPQDAFTKDNVKVSLGGDIILRVIDPKAAAYGAEAPFSLATIYAQAAMRSAIGEFTLDELLNKRDLINKKVFEAVNKGSKEYGVECLGYEIKGLKVPKHVEEEMERQVTSERKRRETVLTSQGGRDAAINEAEGLKKSAELKSEGQKAAQINAAEGAAQERLIEARAEAEALHLVGEALRRNPEAATMRITSEALDAWKGMLGKSNTIVTSPNSSAVEALLTQALATYSRSEEHVKDSFSGFAKKV